VEEDLSRVHRLLLGTIQDDPDYMEKPAPEMVVSALNDYNVQVTRFRPSRTPLSTPKG
jgi:hypothetical protein